MRSLALYSISIPCFAFLRKYTLYPTCRLLLIDLPRTADYNYTVVNILVLFVLLRKFLYRPVMNVIEQRQKQIDDAIADAEGKKNDAQAVLAQAQDKLQNVDTEAAQRREAYEKQAEKEKEQLLQDAQRQADAIVAEGKAAAEAEHARRLRDANAETSALARDMCEKLLARNLTQQDDARLLDDLLQKAGDSNGK